jgi:integrase
LVDLDNSSKNNFRLYKNVQPLRTLEDIENFKWALQRFCGKRDYMIFLIGINTGLRIGDILNLTVKEIKGKKQISVNEGKTDKKRILYLSNIYDEIQDYIKEVHSKWLFPSRKGEKPITTIQAYRQFQTAANMIENKSIGTHTMRKTFGYWYYKKTMDIVSLQKIFNHYSPAITLKYIGITDEEIENSLTDFKL